jgi:light-regulated signal transduction histidine kinase (bacteriophytochrome)
MRSVRNLSRKVFHNWRGYLLAIGLVAIATWLKYLAQPNIIPSDVPILYILAIVPTAIFFGFGPAILVCILSLLAYDYFFIPPLNQISFFQVRNAPIMLIFLVVGILFSYLTSNLRRKNEEALREIAARNKSEAELEKYRNHLEELVNQRTTELEKANSDLKQDIIERKQAEAALKQRTTELEIANKELEAFSYSVSHDLRTPLRSIDGFSQAVLEDYVDKLDEQGKDYLNRIRESSQMMAQLIDDLLGLSKVVRAELVLKKVNLTEMAGAISQELKGTEPERQVEFNIMDGVEAVGDANLLYSILQNLLSNAFKFTSRCKIARISFGTKEKDGENVYYINDNGAGFDMKYADKLFRPFQRLHPASEFPGTGIGLATVQRIVERHGGKVWAEGEVGKGASFNFTLDQEREKSGK